jgi:D-threo-aldose 1-dehydrogenase
VIGLGTAPLGGLFTAVDEETALATVDRAWERGVRFFDTAPLYGHGLAEQRLGQALSARPRDEFVLSTKVGRLLRADAPPAPDDAQWPGSPRLHPVFDFGYDATLRSLEESLERLGLDGVDIVLIHDPDDHLDEALSGAFRALARLRDEGVVKGIGAGMNTVEPLLRLAREGDFDHFLVAGRYTLLDRSAAPELLPLCLERGIDVIAGGVFNSGILAGGSTFDYRPAPAELLERAQQLRAACERHGVPLVAAALQFPLRHPAVKVALTGARSPAEVDENLDAAAVPIPDELWSELG